MIDKLYPHMWMTLPAEIKKVLIEEFKIKKTGVSEIFNEQVKSDGYTLDDLKVINIESMMKYVDTNTFYAFPYLWEMVLRKVDFILNPVEKGQVEEKKSPSSVTTAEVDPTSSIKQDVTEETQDKNLLESMPSEETKMESQSSATKTLKENTNESNAKKNK